MRVELLDIKKYFGDVRANDGITLTFEPGKIYGLLGENGAGKSTLMKILSGFQAPTDGQILFDGSPVALTTPTEALKAGVGMVYQDPRDFPPLRIAENHLLAYNNELRLDQAIVDRDINELGSRFSFDVDDVRGYLEGLTLGERQQLELLRLLALGAELLILDEPTTGISAEQKEVLFETMRRLAHEEQKIIVLVSHKLEEVQELCDEAAVLRTGKLIGTKSIPCPNRELVQMMFGEEPARGERVSLTQESPTLTLDQVEIKTHRLDVGPVSMALTAGEVVGLAGLEGSGQRLLLQACAGIIPYYGGSLLFDDKPIAARRSPIFWLPWLGWLVIAIQVLRLIILASGGAGVPGGLFIRVLGALLLGGAVALIGSILVSWTSRSSYHEFQARGGAYLPADRIEEGLISGLSLKEHMALTDAEPALTINWQHAESAISKQIDHYRVIGTPETEVQNLSGGNQQRAMFALLKDKLRVLLLEHPTRGLDVTSAGWIWSLLEQRREDGTAILFMSADLDELLERSDRIAVFFGGQLLEIVDARQTSVEALGHLIGGEQHV